MADEGQLWTDDALRDWSGHEDPEIAIWALGRLVEQGDDDDIVAGARAFLAEHQRAEPDLAFDALAELAPDEASARDVLRTLADDESQPLERRRRALIRLALGDESVGGELADLLLSDDLDEETATELWNEFAEVAPDACRVALAARFDPESTEHPWMGVAWIHVAPASEAAAIIDWIDSLDEGGDDEDDEEDDDSEGEDDDDAIEDEDDDDDDDGIDLEAWYIDAVRALLTRLGAESLAEIDLESDSAVDDLRTATKEGTYGLQQRVAQRLDDEALPVGAWLSEDIEAGPGLSAATDAWYEALSEVLRSNESLTAQIEIGAVASIARARERTLVEEGETAPERAAMVAWALSGDAQRDATRHRIVELWEAGDDAARDNITRPLIEGARGRQFEQRDELHTLLGDLELAEPPAGDLGARIAEAWLQPIIAREKQQDAPGSAQLSRLLTERPALLKSLAEGHLSESEGLRVILEALAGVTDRWAGDLVLANAAAVLASPAYRYLWPTLAKIGDVAGLELALSQWKEGELEIARCIVRLATLHDRLDDVSDAIRAEALAELPGEDDPPTRIAARCTKCGLTGHHVCSTVVVIPPALRNQMLPPQLLRAQPELQGWDGVYVNRVLSCKWCESEDTWAATVETLRSLQDWVLRKHPETSPLKDAEQLRRGGVYMGRVQAVDGKILTRASTVLRALEAEMADDADNPVLWRRLGHSRANMGLWEGAVEAYEKACELDEGELASAVSLVALAMRAGDRETALERLDKALGRVVPSREKEMPEEARRAELTEVIKALVALQDEKVALWVSWDQGLTDPKGQKVILMSAVELDRIEEWNRVGALMLDKMVKSIGLTKQIPPAGGHLERVLSNNPPDPPPAAVQAVASEAIVQQQSPGGAKAPVANRPKRKSGGKKKRRKRKKK